MHVWRPPPSRTTAPTTTTRESILRPRMEPPRFTGEDASNWIHKIQRYFNHSYTPESDRLYLVTFLFDPPASDWATYWKENNTEKGWDDFLIAVRHRFDANLSDDYISNNTTIKPTDPPAFPSDTREWGLPPSLTQPLTGVVPVALPRPHFDAPRFDGENVVEWIRNIQRYYNHCYTPLSDRLYLTKYLFDQPASDWMTCWKYNHVGEGWDDFLLAVYHRFAPEKTEDDVSHVVNDDQLVDQPPIMKSPTNIISNGIGVDTINCSENAETITEEVFALAFFDEAGSCVFDQVDALTSNECMDSSCQHSNTLGTPQVNLGIPYIVGNSKTATSDPVYVGADCILDSSFVLDEKMARRNMEEYRKHAYTPSIPLNVEDLMVSKTMKAGCNKKFHENDYGKEEAVVQGKRHFELLCITLEDTRERSDGVAGHNISSNLTEGDVLYLLVVSKEFNTTSHLIISSFETSNYSPPSPFGSPNSLDVGKSSSSLPNLYASIGFVVEIIGLETAITPTASAATITVKCSDDVDDYKAKYVVSQPHHLASSLSTLDKSTEVHPSHLVSFSSNVGDNSHISHFGATMGVKSDEAFRCLASISILIEIQIVDSETKFHRKPVNAVNTSDKGDPPDGDVSLFPNFNEVRHAQLYLGRASRLDARVNFYDFPPLELEIILPKWRSWHSNADEFTFAEEQICELSSDKSHRVLRGTTKGTRIRDLETTHLALIVRGYINVSMGSTAAYATGVEKGLPPMVARRNASVEPVTKLYGFLDYWLVDMKERENDSVLEWNEDHYIDTTANTKPLKAGNGEETEVCIGPDVLDSDIGDEMGQISDSALSFQRRRSSRVVLIFVLFRQKLVLCKLLVELEFISETVSFIIFCISALRARRLRWEGELIGTPTLCLPSHHSLRWTSSSAAPSLTQAHPKAGPASMSRSSDPHRKRPNFFMDD